MAEPYSTEDLLRALKEPCGVHQTAQDCAAAIRERISADYALPREVKTREMQRAHGDWTRVRAALAGARSVAISPAGESLPQDFDRHAVVMIVTRDEAAADDLRGELDSLNTSTRIS